MSVKTNARTKAKTLVLDIETSPLLVYVWGLREQNVTIKQIFEDWKILAWSAKWLGDSKAPKYYDLRSNPSGSDLPILKPLWKLLDEADIIITQNGKEFDSKKINARFMLNGMKPPRPYTHLDTYQIVRKVAAFTSNSLEYLTAKFCKKHRKLSHSKFGGWSLWIECLKGNREAWAEMRRYNVADVLSTEELYLNIRAWAPDSMPKIFSMTSTSRECGTCGYVGQMLAGKPRRAKRHSYVQHSCPKCGAWQKGEKILEVSK